MIGNVWKWTESPFGDGSAQATIKGNAGCRLVSNRRCSEAVALLAQAFGLIGKHGLGPKHSVDLNGDLFFASVKAVSIGR